MKTNFAFVIVDKSGKVLAGADEKATAEQIARTIAGTVRENALIEISGDMSFNGNTIYFNDEEGNNFNEALGASYGVKFPSSGRGGRAFCKRSKNHRPPVLC